MKTGRRNNTIQQGNAAIFFVRGARQTRQDVEVLNDALSSQGAGRASSSQRGVGTENFVRQSGEGSNQRHVQQRGAREHPHRLDRRDRARRRVRKRQLGRLGPRNHRPHRRPPRRPGSGRKLFGSGPARDPARCGPNWCREESPRGRGCGFGKRTVLFRIREGDAGGLAADERGRAGR